MEGEGWSNLARYTSITGDDLRQRLGNIYASPKYSDIVVRCQGREFHCHRVILCTQSDYFATMFDGGWKEATESVVTLHDDDVNIVEAMMRHFYSFDYDDQVALEGKPFPALFNALVYSIADKYACQHLRKMAVSKFEEAITEPLPFHDFMKVITTVYQTTTSTDRALRDFVIAVAHKNISTLHLWYAFMDILEEIPQFAADITKVVVTDAVETAEMTKKEKKMMCPSCSASWTTTEFLHWNRDYTCFRCNHTETGEIWKKTVDGHIMPTIPRTMPFGT